MARISNPGLRVAVQQEHMLDPEASTSEIAERVGISRATANAIYAQLGIKVTRKRRTLNLVPRGTNTAKAIALRKASPCMSLQDIGDKVGLSRERVRQILTRDGLVTKHVVRQTYYCMNCGKPTRNMPRRWRRYIVDNEVFCNGTCAKEFHTLTLTCSTCGKVFKRPAGEVINAAQHPLHKGGLIFCSKVCHGRWLGTHHGRRTTTHLIPFQFKKRERSK